MRRSAKRGAAKPAASKPAKSAAAKPAATAASKVASDVRAAAGSPPRRGAQRPAPGNPRATPSKPRATPRRTHPPAGYAAPASQEHAAGSAADLISTSIQAAAELAQIGLAVGRQTLQTMIDRLPKP